RTMTDAGAHEAEPGRDGREVARGRAAAGMHGVLLTVAYDGGPFSGFARQPNARTVAGELDGAVRSLSPTATPVRGASRTDAGVHALGQRVAFDTPLDLPARAWLHSINRELPPEIRVTRAATAPVGLEPRFVALRKTYRYVLFESRVADPFLRGRAWRIPDRLNHELMREVALPLLGEHDFAAFRAAGDEREDTVRRLFRIEVRTGRRDDERLSEVVVEGNRFMYRMVRIIVGSLVDVAIGRLDAARMAQALHEKKRERLGRTAPPEGLYLDSIVLGDDGRDAWP
ncbi:MAG TPA: tRNA pseudouridine(38-40) synthase TruA, partial [Polyangiaceae bacterium]|nr:tRNA pseudouridine(38-40) synthase TruA [Polyangiaceae bacterium]